jgi:hypothetical protein
MHHCSYITLYRKVEGDNGVVSYANPNNFCPACVDIASLGHWVERPAGHIPFVRDNKGNPFNHGGH